MTRFVCTGVLGVLVSLGCGGGDEDVGDNGSTVECGYEDRYLPYQVGYQWTFRVSELSTGDRKTKSQVVMPEISDPVLGTVLVQETSKNNGTTRSLLVRAGDAVRRLRQEDYNAAGELQRTTEYDPGQNRLDEAPANLSVGATWQETYTETEYDGLGVMTSAVTTVDNWEVLGVDVECTSPFGVFSCLHVRRLRTEGGVADKQFWFARGIGKVREQGPSQIEELTGCGPM